jgi:hypothetical protein
MPGAAEVLREKPALVPQVVCILFRVGLAPARNSSAYCSPRALFRTVGLQCSLRAALSELRD